MRDPNFYALDEVRRGGTLDATASEMAFDAIMSGTVPEIELEQFLLAQAVRGPTVPEIVGAVRSMRAHMRPIAAPEGAIDLCGTGGDGHGTLNISTAVSFVVAACGVPVAKHGNRSASSKSGAADILEALGVKIGLEPAKAEQVLAQTGIVFLFAQVHHPAMKHVGPVRSRIKRRTIFNLLGPLASPARVKRQLVGVYAKEWLEPYAEALRDLGSERAMIVHGADGLDELTITDKTHVATLTDGTIVHSEIVPEDAGLKRWPLTEIKGGDARQNASALLHVLEGDAPAAYHNIVLLNSAAALVVAEKAANLPEGADMATSAIRSGRALAKLNNLRVNSNAP